MKHIQILVCVRITQRWLVGGFEMVGAILMHGECDVWGIWCVAHLLCGDLFVLIRAPASQNHSMIHAQWYDTILVFVMPF